MCDRLPGKCSPRTHRRSSLTDRRTALKHAHAALPGKDAAPPRRHTPPPRALVHPTNAPGVASFSTHSSSFTFQSSPTMLTPLPLRLAPPPVGRQRLTNDQLTSLDEHTITPRPPRWTPAMVAPIPGVHHGSTKTLSETDRMQYSTHWSVRNASPTRTRRR